MNFPIIKRTAYVLCHVPDLVCFGSATSGVGNVSGKGPERREGRHDDAVHLRKGRRVYSDALFYAPNQVFIGNDSPTSLWDFPRPWWENPAQKANRYGPWGEIMPQEEFYGLLKYVDDFNVVFLEDQFADRVKEQLGKHPRTTERDLERINGASMDKILGKLDRRHGAPIFNESELVGCVVDHGGSDPNLSAHILLENLCVKASGVLAMRHLLTRETGLPEEDIGYVLSCGEEAVGDRGQRGGGGMARAVAECSGAGGAGCDVKAFCCAPIHALVMAACMIQGGFCRQVVVVAGGSLPKLGLHRKYCLDNGLPVIEDVIAGFAVLMGKNDGENPQIRMDCVGKHSIGAGSAPGIVMEQLILQPLQQLHKRMPDVDLYALELHDAQIMSDPVQSCIVSNHFRLLAAAAVNSGHIPMEISDDFVRRRSVPGFAPIQGHIASGVPLLGHARRMILEEEIKNCFVAGRGSVFLGKMTQSSDALSFLMDRE